MKTPRVCVLKEKEALDRGNLSNAATVVVPPPVKSIVGLPRKAVKVEGQLVNIDLNEAPTALEGIGGSTRSDFNFVLLNSVMAAIGGRKKQDAELQSHIVAATAALAAFKPTDEIEGMLAAQAVALHYGAVECLRRAIIPEQPFEIAARMRKDAANMVRTFGDILESLDRKRGKGPQIVRVERVVVHEGGQAIVGNVAPGGTGG
jgi:hypothetical protein